MFLNRIIKILIRHLQNYFTYYLILTIILIVGIILGSLIMDLFDSSTKIFIIRFSNSYYKIAFLDNYQEYSVLRASISSKIFLIIFVLLSGVLNISIFIVPIIILIKGSSLGFTVGFLVSNLGIKGFLVSIGGIYVQNVFILSGLIGLGAISMSMTDRYRNTIGSSRLRFHNRNFNENLFLAGVYSLIIILGSLIEGYLSPIFLSLTLDFFI